MWDNTSHQSPQTESRQTDSLWLLWTENEFTDWEANHKARIRTHLENCKSGTVQVCGIRSGYTCP